MNPSSMLKHPSAFLPVAMSVAALATVLVFIAFNGTAPQADEGTAAHIWQLLMAAQAPIVLFFAAKWVPLSPRRAVPVLALQIVAALAALAPVFFAALVGGQNAGGARVARVASPRQLRQRGSALSLCARARSSVCDVIVDRMVVTRHIAGESRLLAVFLGLVVLLSAFEQPIFTRIVVLADLFGIVSGAMRMLRVARLARLVRGVGRLVELPVAGVVLVSAAVFGHCPTLVGWTHE